MVQAVRFDDLPPDGMVAFLSEAHQHSEFDPSDTTHGADYARLAAVWGCSKCGADCPLEEVLVADGVPRCPHCDASGWENVVPRGRQERG